MSTNRLERWAQWGNVATALIAIGALIIAVWQIRAAEQVQREASARDAFKEYLKLAIDKPELAEARLNAKDASDEIARARYGWFVTYFLYSAEQIFDSFPKDLAWRASLAEEICYHRAYLGGADFQALAVDQHGAEFAQFINESLQQCAASVAAN